MSSSHVSEIPVTRYEAWCELSSCDRWSQQFVTSDEAHDARRAHDFRHCAECYGFNGHESWCGRAPQRGSAAGPSARMDPELSP